MKAYRALLGICLVSAALCICGCGSGVSRSFDKAQWNEGRKEQPGLNDCPAMLHDLMTRHLSLGMSMEAVTNLLGDPEVRTTSGNVTWIRGEFIEQTVYVYQPGLHNGWLVEGTNALRLRFGQGGEGLRDWTPISVDVRPVHAANSEAVRAATPTGSLPLGNLKVAGTPSQFDALLGAPDQRRTEYQLDYFLGKKSRFAWDTMFLELHFDDARRLSEMSWSEH